MDLTFLYGLLNLNFWEYVLVTFIMVQIAPGSPFSSQRRLPPEIEHNLKAKYGFDKPKHIQYIRYMGRLLGFKYAWIGTNWKPERS